MFNLYPFFKFDSLSGFVVLFIVIFTILIIIYSSRSVSRKQANPVAYYSYLILTAISSVAVALANNLLILLIFWGFLGFTLFLLINMGRGESSKVAKKTFIIVGGSDAFMLLGIGIIYYLSATFQMDKIDLSLSGDGRLATLAYLCLAVACFAKAGAMPFHTWIPDCAKEAPVAVVAYLPASLDKLLGIYLLARISLDLFVMNQAMNLFLMVVGAFTIIAAVMMALVQHNLKRLLGYHAVSQVGYMVLGIGSGMPVGIAGGIFHMLNHAIYKSCLFLSGGNVEKEAQTTELDKLGGLGKFMPLTYISCLIASLSISGVPPFNGFVSKWMVYQGLINNLSAVSPLGFKFIVTICLAAAMFGSALTLASFMKLIHATFLGQRPKDKKSKCKEAPWAMWLPCLILAVLCILFGIFANQIPLRYFILPSIDNVTFIGTWYAGLSTLLIVIGLIVGLLIFKLKNLRPLTRRDSAFVGGEGEDFSQTRLSGTEFYNSVRDITILKVIYNKAEKGIFDIYDRGKVIIFNIGRLLQYLHNGVLPTYLVWTLLGMIALFLLLFK